MKRTLFVLTILAVLLAACGVKATSPMAEPLYADAGRGVAPGAPPVEMAAGESYDLASKADAANAALQERLVIKNSDMSIVVSDPAAKMDAIARMAEGMGGFVVSSSLYQSYDASGAPVPEATITVRIPAEQLDAALEQIAAGVVEVRSKNTYSQDVTAEYVDLGSRLKNLEAAEAALTEIMAKAEKTEDVLAVFNQLTYYREQIEVVKGQMQYYEQAAALSSISVAIIAEEKIQPIEIGGWKPEGVARDAIQTLINFLQGFVNFLIWLVIFILPLLIVIFGPLLGIIFGIRALARKRKAKKAK